MTEIAQAIIMFEIEWFSPTENSFLDIATSKTETKTTKL